MSRIERIEAEIAKQLALVIQQDGVKDPRVRGLISVLRVTVDTELSYAKVYKTPIDDSVYQDLQNEFKSKV